MLKAYYKKRYQEEFKTLRKLEKIGALEFLDYQKIALILNYKSHNTGKNILEKYNKYYK